MKTGRTGVFICACGPNIADRIDIQSIAKEISNQDGVVVSETYGLLCSPDGKKYLEEKIRENSLDRVVIAACSPREHQLTFMKVCEDAGLNPFLMQMANIREQVAWVTSDKGLATEKAMKLIRGALNRSITHRPLEKASISCNPDVVIFGGGVTGMTTALLLADSGRKCTIIHRDSSLGSSVSYGNEDLEQSLVEEILGRDEIEVVTDSGPVEIIGFFGNFIVRLSGADTEEEPDEIEAGALVLATGCSIGEDGSFSSAKGFVEIAEMLRIDTDEFGFPSREHGSLAPVSTPIDGIYVTGCAGGPCRIAEGIARSEAVAGTILSVLIPGRELLTEPRTSIISTTLCRGCRTCMQVCGYGAISFSEETLTCSVNSVLCKGCGNCAAACPSGAIKSLHFTPDQIGYELTGLLR